MKRIKPMSKSVLFVVSIIFSLNTSGTVISICHLEGIVSSIPKVYSKELSFKFSVKHGDNSKHQVEFCNSHKNKELTVYVKNSENLIIPKQGELIEVITLFNYSDIIMF